MKLASGHEVVKLPEEVENDQKNDFEAYSHGVLKLQPGNWFFTNSYLKYADAYYNFKFRPGDVVIVTFPKCGTTWMQEIVWTMRNNPNLDNPLDQMPVNAKCPFVELDFIIECPTTHAPPPESMLMQMFFKACPGKDPKNGVFLQLSEVSPDPRTVKTHLPFSLMPPNMLDMCKVVYFARNPKDAVVSFHHHSRIMKGHQYVGSFDKFVDHFVQDNVLYGPYWNHLKEAWERKDNPNLHLCYYEDMKSDPKKGIRELSDFLGTNLTDEQIDNVVQHTSFEAMKKRDNLIGGKEEQAVAMRLDIMEKEGGFFRKGQTGDYKNKLTEEQEAKLDEWIKKNTKPFGDKFKYLVK